MIETDDLLTLIPPCRRTDTTVLIKTPQDVEFSLPQNICDGCVARLKTKKNDAIFQSIEIVEPEFKGRCIRSKNYNRVDFY